MREGKGRREEDWREGNAGKGDTCHTNPSLLPAPLYTPTQPSIPLGSVNEDQLLQGRKM